METREIKIDGQWCSIGDYVEIKENPVFLFWYLPFLVKRKYQIYFIGNDSSALLTREIKNKLSFDKTIVGSVRILSSIN